MTPRFRILRLVLPLLCGLPSSLLAELQLAPWLRDGAVLQRDRDLPIWGRAAPGAEVTVSFGDHATGTTTANASGAWSLTLPPLAASFTPQQLVVRSAATAITVQDILVGEVWLCSGQSNMEWPVARALGGDAAVASANHPAIRQLKLDRKVADAPAAHATSRGWQRAVRGEVADFTAVGYAFALDYQAALQVPVGLINSTWGGTRIEAWMSRDALDADPAFAIVDERWQHWLDGTPEREARYRVAVAAYEEAEAAARQAGSAALTAFQTAQKPPRRPPPGPGSQDTPAGLFNGMIAPLLPVAVRGVLWYQGEANTRWADEYHPLFRAMITDWRTQLGDAELPFYWVQLANFLERPQRDPDGRAWARLRAAQTATLALPHTAQAVILDIGDNQNIHPANKREVGARLARIALQRLFDRPGATTGPILRDAQTENGTMRIRFSFERTDAQLRVEGETVRELELAGADGVFHPATGTVAGRELIVTSPAVPAPRHVRYAWRSDPEVNFFGTSGLPVAPFSTSSP